MIDLNEKIEKAKTSKFAMWKLNKMLQLGIPFNLPHKIQVVEIGDDYIKSKIPLKWRNKNHLNGIHACGLATVAEFTSGCVLLSKLGGFKKYRIIMESIEMKYHYQAKTDAIATFTATEEWLKKKVSEPLEKDGITYVRCEIPVHDTNGNLVATGYTNWQIKDWKQVKTKK